MENKICLLYARVYCLNNLSFVTFRGELEPEYAFILLRSSFIFSSFI
jgi:hypothetical protein